LTGGLEGIRRGCGRMSGEALNAEFVACEVVGSEKGDGVVIAATGTGVGTT